MGQSKVFTTLARLLLVSLGTAAVVLAFFSATGPFSSGRLGLKIAYKNGATIAVVASGSPAERAGLRSGERIAVAAMPLEARMAIAFPRNAGTVHIPVLRGSRIEPVPVVPEEIADFWEGRYVDLALALLYVLLGIVVLIKGRNQRLSTQLAWLMILYAAANASADFGSIAAIVPAFWVDGVLQTCLNVIISVLAVRLIASLPVGTETVRKRLMALAWPIGLIFAFNDLAVKVLIVWIPVFSAPIVRASLGLSAAVGIATGAFMLSLVSSAPEQERVRTRWFISTIASCWFLGYAAFTINVLTFDNRAAWLFLNYFISLAALGPVYATLRHRLVDLDFFISRSAVFGLISVLLVGIFVAAEWVAGKVTDLIAVEGSWHGIATQFLSFAIAISVGIYAHHIRAGIETRVNAFFFRERAKRLALLRSFAREADFTDSRQALLHLTFEAVSAGLATSRLGLYVRDGERYACVRMSDASAPEWLDRSSRLILQLLDRTEPFQSDVETLHDWLIVPFIVRTDVVGFIACGPKTDHTMYDSEERTTLATVAHHVASSYALMMATLTYDLS